MKRDVNIGVPVVGSVIILAVSFVLSAVAAALFGRGVLPMSAMQSTSWIITFLGCLLGGVWVSGKTDTMVLPKGLLAGGIYLLFAFIMRGILFQSVGDKVYIPVLAGTLGAVLGAVLSAGKGKKRHRR